jgi:hypothetical protein
VVCSHDDYGDYEWFGALIDGRNRLDALALLGLLFVDGNGDLCTKRWIHDKGWIYDDDGELLQKEYAEDGDDPFKLALSYNVHRRHLTAEQKRELIAKVLKAKPTASNSSIAAQVKVNDKTVASVRRELESNSEIPDKPDRIEKTGRKARGRKPGSAAKPKAVTEKPVITTPVTDKDTTAKPKAPVNAKDGTLERFDAYVLELIRITKGRDPKRFAKTAVNPDAGFRLGSFVRKLFDVARLPKADASAEDSAEQHKAEYAAGEGGDR